MLKVFVDGQAGTTGLRIIERLQGQKDVQLSVIPEAFRKDINARKEYICNADIAFLCLPDDAAREAVKLAEGNVKLIDASTAHRTDPDWAYGFPELGKEFRQKVETYKRIAVPGCHASGFLALVYPLVKEGIIGADYPVSVFSLTGYSGGGKKMIAEYGEENRGEIYDSCAQYALGGVHKHQPEMQKIAGLTYTPAFQPIIGDYYAGMEVTFPLLARYMKKPLTPAQLKELYADYYAGSPVVKTAEMPEGRLYSGAMAGKDGMKIYVGGTEERPLAVALFDNLGKGASGAALQCMNIAAGWAETTMLNLDEE